MSLISFNNNEFTNIDLSLSDEEAPVGVSDRQFMTFANQKDLSASGIFSIDLDSSFKKSELESQRIDQLKPILAKVRKEIIYSPNFADRNYELENFLISKNIQTTDPKFKEQYSICVKTTLDDLIKYRQLKDDFILKHTKENIDSFLYHSISSKLELLIDFGNCHEMALAAFRKLIKNSAFRRVEVVEIIGKNADHIFLVLDRDEGSQIGQWEKWGELCIIFDPWSGGENIFLAKHLLAFLKNFEGLDDNKHAKIGSFDPNLHTFGTIVSKMWSKVDLESRLAKINFDSLVDADKEHVAQIKDLFETFLGSDDLVIKKDAAQKIISFKIQDPKLKKIFRILKSQLKYSLDQNSNKLLFIGIPKKISAFGETLINDRLFEDAIPVVLIDQLVKIAERFEKGDQDKAEKKLNKLNGNIRASYIKSYREMSRIHQDQSESFKSSQAVYGVIAQLVDKARKNGRLKEANIIISRMPQDHPQ